MDTTSGGYLEAIYSDLDQAIVKAAKYIEEYTDHDGLSAARQLFPYASEILCMAIASEAITLPFLRTVGNGQDVRFMKIIDDVESYITSIKEHIRKILCSDSPTLHRTKKHIDVINGYAAQIKLGLRSIQTDYAEAVRALVQLRVFEQYIIFKNKVLTGLFFVPITAGTVGQTVEMAKSDRRMADIAASIGQMLLEETDTGPEAHEDPSAEKERKHPAGFVEVEGPFRWKDYEALGMAIRLTDEYWCDVINTVHDLEKALEEVVKLEGKAMYATLENITELRKSSYFVVYYSKVQWDAEEGGDEFEEYVDEKTGMWNGPRCNEEWVPWKDSFCFWLHEIGATFIWVRPLVTELYIECRQLEEQAQICRANVMRECVAADPNDGEEGGKEGEEEGGKKGGEDGGKKGGDDDEGEEGVEMDIDENDFEEKRKRREKDPIVEDLRELEKLRLAFWLPEPHLKSSYYKNGHLRKAFRTFQIFRVDKLNIPTQAPPV
ncbi:hypothetical protein HDV00_012687 [Rhizophlyctis rosea]|nr:hypothetical protein HDV00_012687 [Rhizophlyctis rosea]